MNSHLKTNRRRFLGLAGAAAAAPYFVKSGVLAARGRPGAGDRITVAHIGIGGMGGAHLGMSLNFRKSGDVNIAALCDVDSKRLGQAAAGHPQAKTYEDWRKLVEQKDLDAVIEKRTLP